MLYTIFDLSNIAAGILLATGALNRIEKSGTINKLADWLGQFKIVFGFISLILGIILLFKPWCFIHDITGVLAGILLVSSEIDGNSSFGGLINKAAGFLGKFAEIIGIAAIIVGVLGLLNIHILC